MKEHERGLSQIYGVVLPILELALQNPKLNRGSKLGFQTITKGKSVSSFQAFLRFLKHSPACNIADPRRRLNFAAGLQVVIGQGPDAIDAIGPNRQPTHTHTHTHTDNTEAAIRHGARLSSRM